MTEKTPVQRVITTVAEVTDSDPTELPPLNDSIDPEALNTLFTSQPSASRVEVSFRYAKYRIIIQENGEVSVQSPRNV